MGDYQRVLDALEEHDLSWRDVDRICLNEDTHMEFYERSGGDMPSSNYSTSDAPAIRVTNGAEKVVWVDENGIQQEVKL
jgi:hypothetical protein